MVYDRNAREHHLWVRRIKIGPSVTWREVMNKHAWVVKRIGERAAALMSYQEKVSLGVFWKEVLPMVKKHARRQFEMLSGNDYIDVRGFVAWTVYPSPLWAQRIIRKRSR